MYIFEGEHHSSLGLRNDDIREVTVNNVMRLHGGLYFTFLRHLLVNNILISILLLKQNEFSVRLMVM